MQEDGEVEHFLYTRFKEQLQQQRRGVLFSDIYIKSSFVKDPSIPNPETLSITDLISEIDTSPQSSFLVLGDSGFGKTLIGHQLCSTYWERRRESKNEPIRIPIYIYLPDYSNTKCVDLLKHIFSNGASENDRKQSYLLILDSYDELSEPFNIFESQRNEWSWDGRPGHFLDVKVVILSRKQFIPIENGKRMRLFEFEKCHSNVIEMEWMHQEYWLMPFNNIQIQEYVTRFVQALQSESIESHPSLSMVKKETKGTVWEENSAEYWKWFTTFPDLIGLAETPLLLTIILLILPKMIKKYCPISTAEMDDDNLKRLMRLNRLCSTKTGIYDEFTEQWFEYQTSRIISSGQPEDLSNCRAELVELLYVYSQNLGAKFLREGYFTDNAIPEEETLSADLADPWRNPSLLELCRQILPLTDAGKAMTEEETETDECEKNRRKTNLECLRDSCLLQFHDGKYRFSHRSLAIYFASKQLFETLTFLYQSYILREDEGTEGMMEEFKKRSSSMLLEHYLEDEDILRELGSRVKINDHFTSLLLDVVYKSKELETIAILSSNAISILNIGGYSFSGHDFQDIQIPKAKLDYAILGNIDLRGANLEGVSLQQAWLPYGQLQAANVFRIELGEEPGLEINEGTLSEEEQLSFQDEITNARGVTVYTSGDQGYYLVPNSEGSIFRFNVRSLDREKLIDKSFNPGKHINCHLFSSKSNKYLLTYSQNDTCKELSRSIRLWDLSLTELKVPVSTLTVEDKFMSTNSFGSLATRMILNGDTKMSSCSNFFGFEVIDDLFIYELISGVDTNTRGFRHVQKVRISDGTYGATRTFEMFESNGNYFLSYAINKILYLYQYSETGQFDIALLNEEFSSNIFTIHFCASQDVLALGEASGEVSILSLVEGPGYLRKVSLSIEHVKRINALTSAGDYLASTCVNKIVVWKFPTKSKTSESIHPTKERVIFNSVEFCCDSFAMTPNADFVALGSMNKSKVPVVRISQPSKTLMDLGPRKLRTDLLKDIQIEYLLLLLRFI